MIRIVAVCSRDSDFTHLGGCTMLLNRETFESSRSIRQAQVGQNVLFSTSARVFVPEEQPFQAERPAGEQIADHSRHRSQPDLLAEYFLINNSSTRY